MLGLAFVIAAAWVVFGLIGSAHADEAPPAPAPAAQTAGQPVIGLVGKVTDVVKAVVPLDSRPVAAVVTPVAATVDRVVANVPVVAPIVAPVAGAAPVSHIVAPVAAIVDNTLASVVPAVAAVTDPLSPVLSPITDPLVPIVGAVTDPLLPIVSGVSDPILPQGPIVVVSDPADDSPVSSVNVGIAGDVSVTSAAPGARFATISVVRESAAATAAAVVAGQPGTGTPSPFAPASPTEPVAVVTSGSSSAQSGGFGPVSAGTVDKTSLPLPSLISASSASADDVLPTSLSIDPGSSPD